MGKKCYFCNKRKAKYPIIVYPYVGVEKEVEVCVFCYKRYKKMKDYALVKVFCDMVTEISNNKRK